jgi:2-polyprenyl-3-methyl-5-hydroxy-6-metoxy-1,4-benzoquinol methylase
MLRCNICNHQSESVEDAWVRSNVRKFRDEQFRVWRCASCGSVHAHDEVDLAHYYASYPFHTVGEQGDVDWMLTAMYRNQLRRLRAAGLQPEHAVLDYGCGGGAFLKFLRQHGYANVHGFDEYSKHFSDRSVLGRRYDLVITQDVIEHVAEPWEFLNTLSGLLAPSGVVVIGTPNAQALDLANPGPRVHALHQPYHRHILSKAALLSLGDKLDWELQRYYSSMYSNTLVPFVNQRFLLHYFQACDDTVDLVTEPIQVKNPRLYTLNTLFWAFFGYFFAPETDVTVVYRKRAEAPQKASRALEMSKPENLA